MFVDGIIPTDYKRFFPPKDSRGASPKRRCTEGTPRKPVSGCGVRAGQISLRGWTRVPVAGDKPTMVVP
jgi:hypothetical protein